jgi:hypothetical protein
VEQKKIPPDRPPKDELGSWKEIAHHLGVNVRTAQKWERERAMPVRRSSGVRGRVSADSATLDAWSRRTERAANQKNRCYCWPLGPDVAVEVRFIGVGLASEHVDLLREYLDLFKAALA